MEVAMQLKLITDARVIHPTGTRGA